MKNLLSLLTCLTIVSTHHVFADSQLPANLEVVDEFLGQPDWDRDFSSKQVSQFDFVEAPSSPVRYQVETQGGSADSVEILSSDSKGKLISKTVLRRSDWESQNGNWVRLFMTQTESSGYKLQVDQVQKVSVEVQINGKAANVEALQVQVSGTNGLGWTIVQTYVITNEIRGVAGLVLRSEVQEAIIRVQRSHRLKEVTTKF